MRASLMNLKNKRGQITIFIFFGIIIVFAIIFFILLLGIIAIKTNEALNIDLDLGQVNLAELNAQTYGKYTTMILDHADFIGICAIFGMILGLFLSSYFVRGTYPKWGIILDIFIIIAFFIFSIYLSQAYTSIVNALAQADLTFLEDYMNKTSMFIVNLPIFTVVIGAIMMFLFHSSLPKRKGEISGEFTGI